LDASPYENASIIHDLNLLLTDEKILTKKFDTILDFGLIEHVFNVPNALSNIKKLCKLGGQIIHVQIHNDQSGHGFWQFSPELFFSWYSNLNGFSDTEVYIVDIKKTNYWVKVEKPTKGERIILEGKGVPYSMILVYSKKIKDTSSDNVYQSDYEYLWKKSQNENYKSDSEIFYLEDLKSLQRKTFSKIKSIINPYNSIFYFQKLINRISFKPWYKSKKLLRKRKEYFFKLKKN